MKSKVKKSTLPPAARAYYHDRVQTIMNNFHQRLAQIRRERREVVERIQQAIDREKIKQLQNK